MEEVLHFVEIYSAYVFKPGILVTAKATGTLQYTGIACFALLSQGLHGCHAGKKKVSNVTHLEEMWAILVQLVEHYCRPNSRVTLQAVIADPDMMMSEDDYNTPEADEGPPKLLIKGSKAGVLHGKLLARDYARLAEDNQLPDNIFTSNLHMLCCRYGVTVGCISCFGSHTCVSV